MSRFDLHPTGAEGEYLLDLQSDFLDLETSRMVVPIVPKGSVPNRLSTLHPAFDIDGEEMVMVTHLMGAVPKTVLRTPVRNLSDQHDRITRALDMLFQGY